MKGVPSLKPREVIKGLEKFGFVKDRQKGSHLILINPSTKKMTVVPIHKGKDIKKKLLLKIIEEDCGLKKEEFLSMIKK